MSKIFYDHLIVLEELEHHIKHAVEFPEEREELWHLIDEIIHHRVLGCILDNLPREHHEEFLSRFHQAPHDEEHIKYLNEKIGKSIEDVIQEEMKIIEKEILEEVREK